MFKCLIELWSYVVHCREFSHSSNIDLQEQMNIADTCPLYITPEKLSHSSMIKGILKKLSVAV
jgi:hypothetical protein